MLTFSIFEKPKHSVCFITSVPITMFSYCMNFCFLLRTVKSICLYFMKIKTNMFFWRLNNDFANILQKVRSFHPIVFQWAFIRGWYFV